MLVGEAPGVNNDLKASGMLDKILSVVQQTIES